MLRTAAVVALTTCLTVGLGLAQERVAQTKPAPTAQEASAPAAEASKPAVGAAVDPNTYKIGIEDILLVQVWREQDLTRPVVVRPDGRFSMPLIGEVEAQGLTPNQLQERLTTALEKFLTKPQVFVSVQQVNSKRYYITGEVNRTGPFQLVTPITVLEALSSAGGLREFANGKKIVIMRGNERLKFNYKDVIRGKNMEQNILLQPGDHIIVP